MSDQNTATAPDVRKVEGISLWKDGLRRLRKNRMAVVGFWVVVMMTAVSMSADLLPLNPTSQEPWAKHQLPWSSHPRVKLRMPFSVGDPLPSPYEKLAGEHDLVFTLEPKGVKHRITLRRNLRIRQIAEHTGATPLRSLEVSGPEQSLKIKLSERTVMLTDIKFERGKKLPDGIPEDVRSEIEKSKAFELFLMTAEEAGSQIRVSAKDSRATSIFRREVGAAEGGGEGLEQILVNGDEVREVDLDGEPWEHFHAMGTDQQGRDMLSRIIYGGRISLMVGIVATLVSLIIGVLYGAAAGYLGGRADSWMMRFVDILYGLPYIFLVILLLVLFGRDMIVMFIALGCVQWLTMARIVRGQVLSLKEKEFIEAARTIGTSPFKIILRHLIPNVLGTVVVYTTLTVPQVILQEAFLSFLGLNVEFRGQALESWGALTKLGMDVMETNPWPLVFSASALSLTLFSLNFLGDGLRDAFDPQQKGKS